MKNDKIKLIVCDLDGTLLNSKKDLTKASIDTLKEAKEKGIRICFASGRYDQMMSVYSEAIGGVDYLLSCNGAYVKAKAGKVLYKECLNDEVKEKIYHYLYEHNMVAMTYTTDHMYYVKDSEVLMKRITDYEALAKRKGYPTKLPASPIELTGSHDFIKDVIKIVAYDEPEILSEFSTFVEGLKNVKNESTGYGLMGVFHPEVSKFSGIEAIKKEMNITDENVIVFGDYDNDLSMFACAKYSVAMANASENVKKAATDFALSNDENGVSEYIKHNIF